MNVLYGTHGHGKCHYEPPAGADTVSYVRLIVTTIDRGAHGTVLAERGVSVASTNTDVTSSTTVAVHVKPVFSLVEFSVRYQEALIYRRSYNVREDDYEKCEKDAICAMIVERTV